MSYVFERAVVSSAECVLNSFDQNRLPYIHKRAYLQTIHVQFARKVLRRPPHSMLSRGRLFIYQLRHFLAQSIEDR